MSNRFSVLMWAAWILALCAGCTPSETVPVKGVLLRNGKPLPNYAVTFYPAKGRTSIAITDAEGRFEMIYTDELRGVVPGKHKVTAHYAPPAVASYDAVDNPVPPADAKAIEEKYGTPQVTQKEIEINEPQTDLQLTLD